MRIKSLENKQKEFKVNAVAKAKAGDKKGAAMLLRKSKMMDNELVKLEGQSIILEKQNQMIQNSKFDKDVFESMKAGKIAVEQNQKQMSIDEMEDIKADIEEQMADADEIGNFFAEAANENQDELMDELDQMLAEDAMNEMEDVPTSNIPIN